MWGGTVLIHVLPNVVTQITRTTRNPALSPTLTGRGRGDLLQPSPQPSLGQRLLARSKDPYGLVPLVNQIRGLNGRCPATRPLLRLLAPARPPEAAGRGQAGEEG